MTPVKDSPSTALSREALQAFDDLTGFHSGYRPVHAKGVLLAGTFTPAAGGANLTRAPHTQRSSTPVWVRFSDFAGVPAIPDNHPDASPRGCAIRFHLAEHSHTDIIAHSVDGFPVRTAEEFVEFLRAIHASGPDAPKPTPIERFLGTHPAALAFVQTPKGTPVSFASENYFSVSAYQFTARDGTQRFGRYRIRPAGNSEYLTPEAAQSAAPDFLNDELMGRLAKGPVEIRIFVQLAAPGDVTDDATSHWPDDREEIEFGTVSLTGFVPKNDAEQRHVIFDPIPRVDGIEPSGDPLLQPRADVYLMSGRRRRSGGPE
jgi:catalase